MTARNRPLLLLIAADAENRSKIEEALINQQSGSFDFLHGQDGEDAGNILRQTEAHPDCVLVETAVSGNDVRSFLTQVWGSSAMPASPVIFLTGSDESFHPELLEAGAQDYVAHLKCPAGFLRRSVENSMRRFAAGSSAYRRLRFIYDATDEYLGLLDPSGILLEANLASLDFADLKPGDVMGKPFWETVWFQFTPGAPEQVREGVEAAAGGAFVRYETPINLPSGEVKFFDLSLDPVFNARGEVINIVAEGRDISQRKRADSRLAFLVEMQNALGSLTADSEIMRVASQRLAEYFELSHCVLVEIDELGREACVLYDHREEGEPDLCGTYKIEDFHSVSDRQQMSAGKTLVVNDVWDDSRSKEQARGFAALGIGSMMNASHVSDGRWKFMLGAMRSKPCIWQRAEEEVLSELATRIYLRLERARSVEALERSYRKLDNVLSSMTDGLAVLDKEWRYIYFSEQAAKMSGLRPEQLVGSNLWELFPAIKGTVFESNYRLAVETGKPVHFEEYFAPLDRWLELHCYPSEEGLSVYFHDVTKRKKNEAALEQVARRKDEFLAMLGHELRNPLTAIRHAVQLAHESPDDESVRHWSSEVVNRQSLQLSRMVDDLLDVARINHGRVELRPEILDLRDVFLRAVAAVKPAMQGKRQHFAVDCERGPLMVRGDAARLEQVLVNLLNNAAKYTPEGGQIHFAAKAEGDRAIVSVEDNGIGMHPEILPHVFELFTQADGSADRAQGGLGIGLTVVKSLVEMHGGEVSAESQGTNKGARFTVSLPLAEVANLESKAAGLNSSTGGEKLDKPVKVLLVDDHVDAARALARLLARRNCEVHVAHDGRAGLQAAMEFQPSALFLDLGLPGMDGYELAKTLRAEKAFSNALFIAISGYAQEADRRKSHEAGFDLHCSKPVDVNVLLTEIRKKFPSS